MNRRGFLASILALGVAPALVRASSIMPVRALDPNKIDAFLELSRDLLEGSVSAEELVRKDLAQAMAKYIDYVFVNGVVGSDDNDGLSQDKPFKTLLAAARTNATKIFVSDSHFDESLPVLEPKLVFSNCEFKAEPGKQLLLPGDSEYENCTFNLVGKQGM